MVSTGWLLLIRFCSSRSSEEYSKCPFHVTSVHAVENLLFFFVSLIFSTAPTQKYYIHTGNILKMTTLYLILCTNGTTNICITIATSCSSVNVVFWTKRWPIWCSKCPFLLPQNKICHDPSMTFKFMKSIIDWGHGMCHTILSYVIWCFDFFSLLVRASVVPWSMRCSERQSNLPTPQTLVPSVVIYHVPLDRTYLPVPILVRVPSPKFLSSFVLILHLFQKHTRPWASEKGWYKYPPLFTTPEKHQWHFKKIFKNTTKRKHAQQYTYTYW